MCFKAWFVLALGFFGGGRRGGRSIFDPFCVHKDVHVRTSISETDQSLNYKYYEYVTFRALVQILMFLWYSNVAERGELEEETEETV